jgi:Protein of unknown function (DUF1761)
MEISFDYVAILVAAVASVPVGVIWYEFLFKNQFKKFANLEKMTKEQEAKAGKTGMVLAFVSALATSIGIFIVATVFANFYDVSFMQAALIAAPMMWLYFFVLRLFMHDAFELRPRALTAIHASYDLTCFVVIAVVLGLFA